MVPFQQLLRHASTQNVSEKESKLKCIQPPQGGHGYGYGWAVLCSVTNFQLRKPHEVRYQVRRISHNGLKRLWLQDVEALTGSPTPLGPPSATPTLFYVFGLVFFHFANIEILYGNPFWKSAVNILLVICAPFPAALPAQCLYLFACFTLHLFVVLSLWYLLVLLPPATFW